MQGQRTSSCVTYSGGQDATALQCQRSTHLSPCALIALQRCRNACYLAFSTSVFFSYKTSRLQEPEASYLDPGPGPLTSIALVCVPSPIAMAYTPTQHFSIARLCTAFLLFSTVPVAEAAHHMSIKAPRKQLRRKLDITPLLVTNNCPETIWPGISTQSGSGPSENGFQLEPGETKNQTVSEDWQGRVWGRTNCTFNSDGSGPASGSGRACYSGDCYGRLNCQVGVSGCLVSTAAPHCALAPLGAVTD